MTATTMARATERRDLLSLDGVTVRFGGHGAPAALDAVDLGIAAHEIVCVLGPSGSGKSTLLRVVAGLQAADSGRVVLEGRDQARVPTHRRGVGLMFQDHQLFPQRDVAGNVAFGLRMRGARRTEQDRTVAELLDLVGLPGAARRAVGSLSGGEQQRVALARALAPSPRLLMLDEPLGQLDRGLRERLVVELRGLFRTLGTTVLAVTHDQGRHSRWPTASSSCRTAASRRPAHRWRSGSAPPPSSSPGSSASTTWSRRRYGAEPRQRPGARCRYRTVRRTARAACWYARPGSGSHGPRTACRAPSPPAPSAVRMWLSSSSPSKARNWRRPACWGTRRSPGSGWGCGSSRRMSWCWGRRGGSPGRRRAEPWSPEPRSYRRAVRVAERAGRRYTHGARRRGIAPCGLPHAAGGPVRLSRARRPGAPHVRTRGPAPWRRQRPATPSARLRPVSAVS